MQPPDVLQAGAALLDVVLGPAGFRFQPGGADLGSGGDFAWGELVRGDRRLELHVRRALGLVTYHLGPLSLAHDAYLRALGVPPGSSQYPGFSDDPLDGFRHLAHDLQAFCAEFVDGDAAVLRRAAEAEADRRRRQMRDLDAASAGDDRMRAEARERFRSGDLEGAAKLLGGLLDPERLTPSERRMLEIGRQRHGAAE